MSNVMTSWWNRSSSGTRVAALGAVTLLLAAMIWVLFSAVRPQYGVLFADLAAADTAVILERLKRDKIPYRLDPAESAIEVPLQQVHEVRLSLMSGNLPLSGSVGFEIFDKQGFGTTEHSQQVSYQRALQGELARTIGTLEQVKSVRVHLVLPQSSLFTRDRQPASAAVTVAMEPGRSLQPGQIVGVQRLVAAAVAGLEPGHVVITDQRGITLSAGDAGAADARLQIKREVEEYLAKKVADMLEGAFGGGQAIVKVDATLNFDNAKTTVQDLLPGREADDGQGRVVRRRQMTGAANGAVTLWTGAEADKQPGPAGSSMEVEYQYGRRVAEVVTAPGAMSRMSIGVIVPGPLAEEKRQRIADLVRMAAGFSEVRGDAISVQALDELGAASGSQAAPDAMSPAAIREVARDEKSAAPRVAAPQSVPARPASHTVVEALSRQWPPVGVGAPALAAVVLTVAALLWQRRRSRLSRQARQQLLEELERALTTVKLSAGRITS